MFTFSFGSAFATTPTDSEKITYDKAVEEIKASAAALESAVEKAKNDALYNIFANKDTAELKTGAGSDTVTVKKDTVEKIYDEVICTPAKTKIAEELNKALVKLDNRKDKVTNTDDGSVTYDNTYGEYAGYFIAGSTANKKSDVADGEKYYPVYEDLKLEDTITVDVKTGSSKANETLALSALNVAKFEEVFKKATSGDITGVYIDDVAVKVVKAAKADALAAINAITVEGVYSKEFVGTESNYNKAVALIKKAQDQIGAINADAATWAALMTADSNVALVNAIYTAPKNQGTATGALFEGTTANSVSYTPGLNNISKIEDLPSDEAKLAWAKNKALTSVTNDINGAFDTQITTATNNLLTEQLKGSKADPDKVKQYQDALDDLKDTKAAAIEVLTYLVNDAKTVEDILATPLATTFTSSTLNATKWAYASSKLTAAGVETLDADLLGKVKKVKALKEDADLLKASIAIDGTTSYEIDKALEKAIDEVYYAPGATYKDVALDTRNTVEKALVAKIRELTGTDKVKVNNVMYKGVGGWTADVRKDQNDEVRAAKKEATDAIWAAKSIEEAEAAFLAGLEKFEKIPTTADYTRARATKEFKDLLDQYNAEITAYVNYKVAGLEAAGTLKNYTITKTNAASFATALKKDFDDAYTVDELKAAYDAAKSKVDALKTTAELQAEKTAIEGKIKALPATVTVADKDTVVALKAEIKDFNEYCDLVQAPSLKVLSGKVTDAYDAVRKAEDRAITNAYNEIMKDGKVTVDEAAAVEALRTAFDAYVKDYTEKDAVKLTEPTTITEVKMEKAEDDLSAAKVKQVEEMIAKLPADGSDVAATKAARAAYDALALKERVTVKNSMYDKLVDTEKMIGKSVTSLKLNASSKAKKGSITVKWTVKGNAAVAEGYQVWKSTKANKGYKKAITTKKTSYKNTKGLKKGTKYYYKVRAYATAADGTIMYSDWSNKAYRKAK